MHITSETRDSILIWQINRPDRRNALGPILAQELWEKVTELEKYLDAESEGSNGLRILAIKAMSDMGDRDPIWIAGGDLRELAELKNPAAGRKYAETMAKVCQSLQALPIPIVALIDGLVIGGGIEFALAADLRFATKRTMFHFKQLELGLSTAYASAGRLRELLGSSRAMNWLLRSAKVSSQSAWDLGLIHERVEDGEALDIELDRFWSDIKDLNPGSIAAQKKLFNLHASNPNIEAELDIFESLWMNPYHQASLKKFLAPKTSK